jgi:hypothetical protein
MGIGADVAVTTGSSRASAAEEDHGNVAADSPANLSLAGQVLWTLAGLALLNWSVQILGAATSFTWVGVLVVLAGLWGLGTIAVSWLPVRAPVRAVSHGGVFQWVTALIVVGMFAVWAYVQVRSAPAYGTDEIAFDQYAAELVRHGMNPYVHSLAPAFSLFQVSPDGYTYDLAGKAVTALSYPALSFEAYLPMLLLGITTQAAVILNVGAWAVTVLMVFGLLPRPLRALALLIGSVGVYTSYAVGGVTDVLYMPLLVLAAYKWDRFGSGSSWRTYVGPVALGLAMAVKQTPWLVLPFMLCAIACESYVRADLHTALRTCAKYVTAAVVAFLIPNLPYIVASPSHWLKGTLTPVISQLVPAGQGTIGLTLFAGVGGGSLTAFTVATGLFALTMLLLYVTSYPTLKRATFVLPSLVLFLASRSYGSYLVALVPAMIVGALTVSSGFRHAHDTVRDGAAAPAADARSGLRRYLSPYVLRRPVRWLSSLGCLAVLSVAALAYSLLAAPALAVSIKGVRTTGQLATIDQVNLELTNRSSQAVKPAFTLDEGGEVTTFWTVSSGPRSLGAHQSARYTLLAPNFPAQPAISGGFSVLAFTRGPGEVASSGPYVPSSLHLALIPAAVNSAVPVGHRITVQAELLNSVDRRVHNANMPVYLGQIIYDQSGLILSEAEVNGSAPGQTPVRAYTNARGVATFNVVGTQSATDPVYFEANLVNAHSFYPYGYSNILPIRFGGR